MAKKIVSADPSGNIPRPALWIGANPDDLGRLLTDLLYLNTANPREVAEFQAIHCRRDVDTKTLNAAIRLILVVCKAIKYCQPLHTKPLMHAYNGLSQRSAVRMANAVKVIHNTVENSVRQDLFSFRTIKSGGELTWDSTAMYQDGFDAFVHNLVNEADPRFGALKAKRQFVEMWLSRAVQNGPKGPSVAYVAAALSLEVGAFDVMRRPNERRTSLALERIAKSFERAWKREVGTQLVRKSRVGSASP